MDLQGFLNDLQDWELNKPSKTSNSQTKMHQHHKSGSPSRNSQIADNTRPSRSPLGQYGFLKNNYDASLIGDSHAAVDVPDAASEKELGNEYFKQKKFKEAIDCYSRSIAFTPSAVAYANRAMAYLKLKRFREAEDDCTEALNLDDRYIKAYSRRATARMELGKLKGSMEDAEFALRLEPNNQEVKKQYTEAKSLYEEEILAKATGALRSSVQGGHKPRKSEISHGSLPLSSSTTQKSRVTEVRNQTKENGHQSLVSEMDRNITDVAESRAEGNVDAPRNGVSSNTVDVKSDNKVRKQVLGASVQELASRAALRALVEAAKNITPPSSAYQFEASWRGFSGDQSLQARLLKTVAPTNLPQIFKDALSATLLIDIIKCVSTFFKEEMDVAVNYLDHLTKVSRFNLLLLCLSSSERNDLRKLWDEVFISEATPMEYADILDNLRSKYLP